MKKIQEFSTKTKNIWRTAVIAAMVLVFSFGSGTPLVHADTVTAIGASLNLSYNNSSFTLGLTGNLTNGNDTFSTTCTMSSGGRGVSSYTETDTFALADPNLVSYTITNSSGATVMSGSGGGLFFSVTPNTPATNYTVCSGSYSQRSISDGSNGSWAVGAQSSTLNVSSLSDGTYTFNFSVNDKGADNTIGPTTTWSNTFTVKHPVLTGTVTVTTDRSVVWQVPNVFSGTTSASQTAPGGTIYNLSDGHGDVPTSSNHFGNSPNGFYGFIINAAAANGSKTGYKKSSSLLARFINIAQADSSYCSDIADCYLDNAGSITWNLNTSRCTVQVNTIVNGGNTNAIAVPYTLTNTSGASDSKSPSSVSGNTPANALMIDDIANATNISLTGYPNTTTYNGVGAVLDTSLDGGTGVDGTPNQYCSQNGQVITFNIHYITEPVLQVK